MVWRIVVLFLFFPALLPADEYTNYKLFGNASAGLNVYSSSFTELPGYYDCCRNYDFAAGLGYSSEIGGEYLFDKQFAGYTLGYSLSFGYNYLAAAYNIEQKLGYKLDEDEAQEVYVNHFLDAGLSYLSINNRLNIYTGKKTDINLGVSVGIPVRSSFEKREELLRPEGLKFENGLEVRNQVSGELPELYGLRLGIIAGAGMEVWNNRSWALKPFINLNYSLTDVISGVEWKAHNARLGVQLSYRIQKPAKLPPMPPPAPKLPKPEPPELPEKPAIALTVEYDGKMLNSGDTVFVALSETRIVRNYKLKPVVIFEKNSTDIYSESRAVQITEMQSAVIEKLKDKQLDIEVTATIDEAPGTIDKRAEFVREVFNNSKITENIIDTAGIKYPELISESRYLKFTEQVMPDFRKIIGRKIELKDHRLSYGYDIKNTDKDPDVTVNINGKALSKPHESIKPSDYLVDGKAEIKIMAEVKDEFDRSAIEEFTLSVRADTSYIIEEAPLTGTGEENEYILGFFDFNGESFTYIDESVITKVKQAIEKGRKVSIIAYTDNLGTEAYNRTLSRERANSALEILGLPAGSAEIIIPEGYLIENDTPYGRMMNRSVLIRIHD
ncbi:MAG: OmpA family protein [Bacteroidota bacterium]